MQAASFATTRSDVKTNKASAQAPQPKIPIEKMPQMMDLRADNITENVHAINSGCENERLKFVMHKLVEHSHNFIRETSITSEEWMTALQFLTAVGQKCTDIRQEFILFSDILGISALVDTINHPKPPNSTATDSTVLGPFLTEDAAHVEKGDTIASEGSGEYFLVEGRVLSTEGKPVPGAEIETWETDADGYYDTQYANREAPDCRGILTSDKDGVFKFRAVVPVSYPIPSDGPVGQLLDKLGRHVFRPAHLHIKVEAPGYETLITSFYPDGDKYLKSDAVFGVKSSLVVDISQKFPAEEAQSHGFARAESFRRLSRDLVLVTMEQADKERKKTMPNLGKTLANS